MYCAVLRLWLQFLQNLGKVDRTADDIFDEHLQNFMRQQNAANRLQKEFNNYIRCVRGKSIRNAFEETSCKQMRQAVYSYLSRYLERRMYITNLETKGFASYDSEIFIEIKEINFIEIFYRKYRKLYTTLPTG